MAREDDKRGKGVTSKGKCGAISPSLTRPLRRSSRGLSGLLTKKQFLARRRIENIISAWFVAQSNQRYTLYYYMYVCREVGHFDFEGGRVAKPVQVPSERRGGHSFGSAS